MNYDDIPQYLDSEPDLEVRRPAAGTSSPVVMRLREMLGLDPADRTRVAVVRVSARGQLDKLDDQLDTGVEVYRDDPDWIALRALPDRPQDRPGFKEVCQEDLARGAGRRNVGWVGRVGQTVFLCVADSAAEKNLPPLPDDPAQMGRNAFTVLLAAVCLAAFTAELHIPFRSRWWRNDAIAQWLLEVLNTHLGQWRLLEGGRVVPTSGAAKLVTSVEGGVESSYTDTFKEQVFTKGLDKMKKGGEWDRRESELPLGLRRARRADGKLELRVELDPDAVAVARKALEMLADDRSWRDIGKYLAEEKVPMPGARGGLRTFAEYSTESARVQGARTVLTGHRPLAWFEHGTWVERRSTALVAPTGEMRNHEVDHEDGRSVAYVDVRMPHTQFLDEEGWDKVHRRLAREEEASRQRGGALHRRDGQPMSPFRGVTPWIQDGVESVLVPDSATAYRWRTREPLGRGWNNNEGRIEATLRRALFNHGLGRALLDAVEKITDPLAPSLRAAQDDPMELLRDRAAELEAEAKEASARAANAVNELLSATDEALKAALRDAHRAATDTVERIEVELSELEASLADGAEGLGVEESDALLDLTEPALVGSLLLDGDGLVEPAVAEALDRYGVNRTLRLRRRTDEPATVRATVTLTLPLLGGGGVEVDLAWDTPDTHNLTGQAPILPALLRRWAAGTDEVDAVAAGFPGTAPNSVRRRAALLLSRGGLVHRGRRAALLDCPLEAPRRIVVAHVLDEPNIASGYSDALTQQVLDAYKSDEPWDNAWCAGGEIDTARRILAVFTDRPETWDGLDISAVASASGVTGAKVRFFARPSGLQLLESVSHSRVRPWRCPHKDCHKAALTAYLPTPETGRGLVCPACRRADGPGVLGEDYLLSWRRTPTGYEVDEVPVTDRPRTEHMLSVLEVSERTGIAAHILRALDAEGELVPDGLGPNRARLYRADRIAKLPRRDLERWRARSASDVDDGAIVLLTPNDAAEVSGLTIPALKQLVEDGTLRAEHRGPGGKYLRFRREDIEALGAAPDQSELSKLVTITEAAARCGIPRATLRRLVGSGAVPLAVVHRRRRLVDPEVVRDVLDSLDLLCTPDNPLVTIGELAEAAGLSTGQVRKLADRGTVPMAGRLGGNRRFRLTDALDALGSLERPD